MPGGCRALQLPIVVNQLLKMVGRCSRGRGADWFRWHYYQVATEAGTWLAIRYKSDAHRYYLV